MWRALADRFLGGGSGDLLRRTAKAILVTAIFSTGAAYYLSSQIDDDRSALAKMIMSGSRVDWASTGSIRDQSVKLDPCEAPQKRR